MKTTDLVLLWARAAGLCSHPRCKMRLVLDGHYDDPGVTTGEAAHIVGRSADGPRGDSAFPDWKVNGYENLILLCGVHHTEIDKDWTKFPVAELRAWKAEHEEWVKAQTGREPAATPWTAIVQDPMGRMDRESAERALGAGAYFEEWMELRGDPEEIGWLAAAEEQRRAVEEMVARTPGPRRRFAVFSTGRIPLALHLGFVLGDRARTALYHFDRDLGTWQWPTGPAEGCPIAIEANAASGAKGEAVIRVSLSARVRPEETRTGEAEVDIVVPEPSVRWLKRSEQLGPLAKAYEEALQTVAGARVVHLYYAGPGGGGGAARAVGESSDVSGGGGV